MKSDNQNNIVVIKGAGEMASGVIHCLYNSGYTVIALEQSHPVCVRRKVCFANAIYENQVEIEGVQAILVNNLEEALNAIERNIIPLLIDSEGTSIHTISPFAVVDARMLKRDVDTILSSTPIQIGLGPGFRVGKNCHVVIETNRGENLGKVIYEGEAQKYTGIPTQVNNFTTERVLRSPIDGVFISQVSIGDLVKVNELIGKVNDIEVRSQIDGVVRGLIHESVIVHKGKKIGDIDPRCLKDLCYKISDKANAIGIGVLEALRKDLPYIAQK